MSHRYSKYFRSILLIGDLLLLNGSFLLTEYLIDGLSLSTLGNGNLQFLVYLNVSWILLAIITTPYRFYRTVRFAKILRGHVTLVLLHFLVSITITAFLSQGYPDQKMIIFTYLLFLGSLIIWRIVFIYSLRASRLKGYNVRRVVIAGYGEVARELYKFFKIHPEHGYMFMGFFDDADDPKIEGKINDLFDYARLNQIDEIYCCLPNIDHKYINKIIDFAESNLIKVKLLADFRGFSFKGLELYRYDHIPVLSVLSTPLDEKKNQFVKRTFDIIFSSLVIITLLSWLTPLVALVIKIDSKGPVFFRQKRAGKNNEHFDCLKFRTMLVNNEADSVQATKNDPRITKIGAFLRKTSIDELPQFFNVFVGDMSIIGPRPHPIKLNERYSDKIYKFNIRHHIKPGITGLAQTKGYRGETKTVSVMKNRVKYDRFYVEKWSLYLDFKILASTINTLFKGDNNAY